MSHRNLRAANRGFYLGTILLVLAACAYGLLCKEFPVWQQGLICAAALCVLLWGGYYVLLRYQVDARGISRYLLLAQRRCILWEELAEASWEQQEHLGTARCTIHLRAHNGTSLTLSSDLLPLEAVEELAAELREHGYLPPSS